MTPQFFQSVSGINQTDEHPVMGYAKQIYSQEIKMSRPRKIDGYERTKRAEYRGQPHTQLIAVGDNRDALLKAKENVINDAIIDAFNESVDLKINQELRELIHRY